MRTPSRVESVTRDPDASDVLALYELLRRPAWHALAACRGTNPRTFYPANLKVPRAAAALCDECPVTAECAEAGRREQHGVWGGILHHGRKRVRPGR